MSQQFASLLLADDDFDDREAFCLAMQRIYPGVSVRTFDDGDGLLEYLTNCPAHGFPSCMLFDLEMSRISAPQLLEATGKGTKYAKIHRVVWSTSSRTQDIDKCLQRGADRFIIKPNTERQLDEELRSLDELIDSKQVQK